MKRTVLLLLFAITCPCFPWETAQAESVTERMRDRLDRGGSITDRLRERGYIAVHDRVEQYPRAEDYGGLDVEYEPVKEIVKPAEGRTKHSAPKSFDLASFVTHQANHFGVDRHLVLAVIQAESAFKPEAVSPAGACGLMQLMPGTAADMGVSDPFDPAQNIAGGTQYLAQMLRLFDGDVELALAAYNAGPATVKRYGGVPPYRETQQYIARVKRFAAKFRQGRRVPELPVVASVPETLPPSSTPAYTLTLQGGYQQRASVVVDDGDYYLVEYQGRYGRIPKDRVQAIAQYRT